MSYAGITGNLWKMGDVSKRLRMLLQGGVYVRTDLDIAGTTCTIGQDGADRNNGNDIPSQFFNGRATPILATLEKQDASGSATLTTESVSISSMPAVGNANYQMQVTLAIGPTESFTTALNSRILLRTHPVTGGSVPPLVKQGYVDLDLSAERPALTPHNLPMLTVSLDEVGQDPELGGNVLRGEAYAYTCTWVRAISGDENIDDQLMTDAEIFMQMIDDDNYLGGGVEFSEPLGITFEPDQDLRRAYRYVHNLDMIHFGIQCVRGEIRENY